MAQYYGAPPPNQGYAPEAQNLQFYQSSYAQPVSGHATPSQASYGYNAPPAAGGYGVSSGFNSGFGGAAGISGRMGEQGGLRTGWLAALSTEGYDGEPPLLEELGIKPANIRAKTLAVINPFGRVDQHLMDDSDLAGPVLFFLLFGTFLVLSGRVRLGLFGFIYGLAFCGTASIHHILTLMSPSDPSPGDAGGPPSSYPGQPASDPTAHGPPNSSFTRSASVLGYCLLPLLVTSAIGVVMPMDTPLGIVLTTAAIMWCTWSASGIFCTTLRMRAMRGLVAYPLAMFYVGFGIMGVFSSRGSGTFAKVAQA
ncbi:hypothetical protein QBC39DRAFT_358911 [Podospora conica]|nr:hypothetical protein QBC39DRAFT_358911 [Schizothecium conicum]